MGEILTVIMVVFFIIGVGFILRDIMHQAGK